MNDKFRGVGSWMPRSLAALFTAFPLAPSTGAGTWYMVSKYLLSQSLYPLLQLWPCQAAPRPQALITDFSLCLPGYTFLA